jgi:hypothetical protein
MNAEQQQKTRIFDSLRAMGSGSVLSANLFIEDDSAFIYSR